MSDNPFRQRHALRADLRAARVARDTVRGKLAAALAASKAAEADAFAAEMDAVVGVEGAAARRDAALERKRAAEAAAEQCERSARAADVLTTTRTAELEALSDREFEEFAVEAEAATLGAESELRALAVQTRRAAEAWSKAAALWRPLNAGLRRRLEDLNEQQGAFPDVARQAVVPAFPVTLPSDLATASPRPAGVTRLRNAREKQMPQVT